MEGADGAKTMITIMDWLILGTEHQARYFSWRAPLAARIVVEWMFMSSGWTKLHNFPVMIENFAGWGISFPSVMKPFVLGLEFVGGLCACCLVCLHRSSRRCSSSSCCCGDQSQVGFRRFSGNAARLRGGRIAVADWLAGHRMCRTCLARSYVAVLVAR
jgi:hypothetical protein